MIKRMFLLLLTLLIVFPLASASSCNDINLQIGEANSEKGYLEIKRYLVNDDSANENTYVKELRIYVDNNLEIVDKEGIAILESKMFYLNLLKDSDLKVEFILNDNTLCKQHHDVDEFVKFSDTNIERTRRNDKIILSKECDLAEKKQDWCQGDLILGNRCENGNWVEFIDVDCSLLEGTCKNSKCVEKGNEGRVISIENEENFPSDNSNKNFEKNLSRNTIKGVFSWVIGLLKSRL